MRIGLVDIGAASVVLALFLLPAPPRRIDPTYEAPHAAHLERVAIAQANAARNPQSGAAAERYAIELTRAGQSDWAFRAGAVAGRGTAPDRWRALAALSKAHAARIEAPQAYSWAEKALEACDAAGSTCTPEDRLYLDIRVRGLKACLDAAADPRMDYKACTEAVAKAVPVIRTTPPPAPPSVPAPAAPTPAPGR